MFARPCISDIELRAKLIARMQGMLQLPAAEARLRVEHALMVGTHRMLTGQTREPQLPATAAAQAMRIRGQRHERTSSLDPTGRANARKRSGGFPPRRRGDGPIFGPTGRARRLALINPRNTSPALWRSSSRTACQLAPGVLDDGSGNRQCSRIKELSSFDHQLDLACVPDIRKGACRHNDEVCFFAWLNGP